MAVTEVEEIWDGRRMAYDDQAERTYVRSFRVLTDDAQTAQLSVLFATGIPQRFDTYADPDGNVDLAAFVQELTAEQEQDDPQVWVVRATYSSKLTQPDFGADDPLSRPTEIEFDSVKVTRPLTIDAAGVNVLNSAGDPFDPPIETEECRFTIVLTRNLLAFDYSAASAYVNSINSDAWFGFAAAEVKCTGIKARRIFEKALFYWQVTFTFEAKPGGSWNLTVLDIGYYQIVNGSRQLILDKFGAALTSPAALNGQGQQVPPPGKPALLGFSPYPSKPFNQLIIP